MGGIQVVLEQNSVPAMLLIFGSFVCLFTPIAYLVKSKLLLSDTLVATLIGIIFGPVALKVFNPYVVDPVNSEWIELMIISSSVVLAIQIVAATITLPPDFWKEQWRSILVLYGPITLYTWTASTLMVWACTGVSFLTALMIGAAITPTDPVLCNSILKGRFADTHVSVPVRELLSAESAGNDGIALPLFLLAVYLLRYYEPATAYPPEPAPTPAKVEVFTRTTLSLFSRATTTNDTDYPFVPPEAHSTIYNSPGEAVLAWFLEVVLYEVCLGALAGILIGYCFRKLLLFSQHRGWIDHESMLAFSIGLAFLLIGGCDVLGIAGFIACFFGGIFFAWEEDLAGVQEIQEAHIQEVIDILVCIAFFIFFGTTIPWNLFNTPELPIWRLFLLSAVYMIFHRLPAVALLYRWLPGLRNHKESFFVGWFGPTAVGALWYISYSRLILPSADWRIIPITWWIVCTSILLHGISVPFTHLTILSISRSRDPAYRAPRAPEGYMIRTNSIAESISGGTSAYRDAQGRRIQVSAPMLDDETRNQISQQLKDPNAFGPGLTDEMQQVSYQQPPGIRSILINSPAAVDIDYDEPFDAAAARAKLDADEAIAITRGDTGKLSVQPRVSFGVSRTVSAHTPSPDDESRSSMESQRISPEPRVSFASPPQL